MDLSVFWFRRDLRLEDNTALFHALNSGFQVLPVFIFDINIIQDLPVNDSRINFIYTNLSSINTKLNMYGSALQIYSGEPYKIWQKIIGQYNIKKVFVNKDYEPYAIKRDESIKKLLKKNNIHFFCVKDQAIFEEKEILKDDGKPYTIFTPYKRKWLSAFSKINLQPAVFLEKNFLQLKHPFPSLHELGFQFSSIKVKPYNLSKLEIYAVTRNIPASDATTYLSPHLRFGIISIRQIIRQLKPTDEVFLGELIWREFFMQILFHFPTVISQNFNSKYNGIIWRNNEHEFKLWCEGKTGFPLVDAGMHQLNTTGYMHNRVRMVVAGFLCKHLLIDWRWGEAYFAHKLLDYELSSNNGNWQWAAGTGCDAAPYFRIFNPTAQLKKFDKDFEYVKKWIPDYKSEKYIPPMVEHTFARQRALEVYKKGLEIKIHG